MRKSTIMAAAGTLFAAALMTGCGGDDNSASGYCDTLKDAAADIQGLSGSSTPDFTKFADAIEVIKDAGKNAPDEVADDWKVVTGGLDEMTAALEDVGLKFEDLGGLFSGQIPEGLDQAELTELGEKLQGMSSEEMNSAMESIEKHAKSECDVDLSASE